MTPGSYGLTPRRGRRGGEGQFGLRRVSYNLLAHSGTRLAVRSGRPVNEYTRLNAAVCGHPERSRRDLLSGRQRFSPTGSTNWRKTHRPRVTSPDTVRDRDSVVVSSIPVSVHSDALRSTVSRNLSPVFFVFQSGCTPVSDFGGRQDGAGRDVVPCRLGGDSGLRSRRRSGSILGPQEAAQGKLCGERLALQGRLPPVPRSPSWPSVGRDSTNHMPYPREHSGTPGDLELTLPLATRSTGP